MFTERLRKYPIVPFLDRISCNEYELPAHAGTGTVTLPAGTGVYIPVLALHYDPKYFSQPQKFDPDRFTVDRTTHIFHLVRVHECASVRTDTQVSFVIHEDRELGDSNTN